MKMSKIKFSCEVLTKNNIDYIVDVRRRDGLKENRITIATRQPNKITSKIDKIFNFPLVSRD